MRPLSLWSLIIILSAAGIGAAVAAGDAALPFRAALAFWFLLICPGMAFVPLLRIGDRMAEAPVVIALSIALDTAVAETLALTGHWSPEGGLLILICLSIAGAALQIMAAPTGATTAGARR